MLLVVLFYTMSCGAATALDRQAFTVKRYQLEVQLDRTSHVIAVTGKVVLHNDSREPQKNIALQVSSSLAWNNIMLDDTPLPWIGDNYTSDIDHTGSLSEAIITTPKETPSGGEITLAIQYGGTVRPDATRLTRIGTPADMAARSEWDAIGDEFTAVRGLGYVTWYPVAIDAVSISDGNAVFDAIAAWKQRHARTEFNARIIVQGSATESLCIAASTGGTRCGETREITEPDTKAPLKEFTNTLTLSGMADVVPTFSIANYQSLDRPTITFLHTAEHTQLARDYALAAEANDPLLRDWLGEPRESARVIELTEPKALPYQTGSMLFTPLRPWPTDTLQLLLMSTQVRARFQSPHAWLQEGMERFLQALSVDARSGRSAALSYLDDFREPLMKSEELSHPKPNATTKATANEADNTLLNTNDELYLRGKGSFVLWMLRDMLGDTAMQAALGSYHAGADKEPAYLQRLLQAAAKRDLEWFFDDWVYRDRGLPDFHVESAYSRALLSDQTKSYLLTVTIANHGRAGAEVPVLIETPSGVKSMRILAKAGEKASGRLELPIAPDKITLNDGSVPEMNLVNNVYNVPPPSTQ